MGINLSASARLQRMPASLAQQTDNLTEGKKARQQHYQKSIYKSIKHIVTKNLKHF